MNVFSYEFYIFWIIGLVLFYTIARKWQWQLLTLAGVIFYALSINKIPLVLLIVWPLSYFACRYISVNRNKKGKAVFVLTIILCVAALIFGRVTGLVALLGNSYFVLKAIGCVIDVDREAGYEKNIFKYLNYLIFWPTMMEGPFNRLDEFTKSTESRIIFDYSNFISGIRRFIWGVFKKLVIAERLAIYTGLVFGDLSDRGGRFLLVGLIAYALQIYLDFSGFMDMMLGVSNTFGIELPENFKQPYFSKSIPEFWRRWHITLGLWFRDYVMFPFTSAKPIKRISKNIRKKNKQWGKLFPLLTGTLLVWVITGLWHGFGINYILWGLYYAVIMMLSLIYNAFKKESKSENKVKDLLAIGRTVLLVLLADSLVCVNGIQGIKDFWYEVFCDFNGGYRQMVIDAGLEQKDIIIILIGLIIVFVVSLLTEKGYSVEKFIDKQPIFVRWGLYYLMIFATLILGLYGSQYDVSQFMYMQF